MGDNGTIYNPDVVFPPGDTLDELLQERGMLQRELAERAGLHRKTINEIIQGKAVISPGVALRLERVLGVPARFWLTLEQHYQEHLARQRDTQQLAKQVSWLDTLPLAEMIQRGLVAHCDDRIEQLRAVLQFFGIATPEQHVAVMPSFRRSEAFAHDGEATFVWLRQGQLLAEQVACEPYSEAELRDTLPTLRGLTAQPFLEAWPQAQRLCAAAGVAAVIVPEFPRTRVCGAANWLSAERAMIVMSLRYRREDGFWFSFFHECGHILLHGKRAMFVDAGEAANDEREQEANRFARELLLPSRELQAFQRSVPKGRMSKQDVMSFARAQQLAQGIVVGRLQHDDVIPRTHMNDLRTALPAAEVVMEAQQAALEAQSAAQVSGWESYLAARDEIAALPKPPVSALADLSDARR